MAKMDVDLKQQWVNALRSGKYEQGPNQLRHKDEFCCLGVLCDIVEPHWIACDSTSEGSYRWAGGDEVAVNYLPSDFAKDVFGEWYEDHEITLNYVNGEGMLKTTTVSIDRAPAILNDDAGMSFEEIADWIEANL